jgi:lipoprotein-releasing system permease protein
MRLLQRKRIALFSLGAVMLCVAMVLIVVSVMGGFLDMVRDRSHNLLGDMVMDAGDSLNGFPYYQDFIDKIQQWPQVEAAAPVIYSYGLLRYESGDTQPVRIVGIRLNEVDRVNGFKKGLFYEEWYPGTTTLKEQPQYVYGVDKQGRPVLPEALEKALAGSPAWQEMQTDPDKAGQFLRDGKRLDPVFPGPGKYKQSEAEPSPPSPWVFQPGEIGSLLPGIIIGRDIIAYRQPSGEYYRRSDRPRGAKVTLTLLPISRTGVLRDQTGALNKSFRYADDSRTGVFEIDSQSVYVDFEYLQNLLGMDAGKKIDGGVIPARASQIQIKAKPGVDLEPFKFELNRAWGEMMLREGIDPTDLRLMQWVRTQTWEEKQWAFISAVEKEKVLMLILFGVISVVAIFLILCIFYMIVVEKTRDIGILKSIGGSAGGVAAVFLSYGAAIGVVGSALGILLGTVFVRYINDIQNWLARLHPELRVWKADVYSFESIPNVVKVEDVVVIGVIAVIASIIGALVPALVAARKHPVESLRYE